MRKLYQDKTDRDRRFEKEIADWKKKREAINKEKQKKLAKEQKEKYWKEKQLKKNVLPELQYFQVKRSENIEPSFAELRIRTLLNTYSFGFLTEISFKNLKTDNKGYYRFDFFIPKYRIIIEYDGIHHCEESVIKADRIKNKFCKKNKIHLYRFNKTHWEKLETHIIEKLAMFKAL